MHDNLVIVESPAKAKTLEKFLGKDFVVKSSYGHIRDLAKKDLGINIDNGFAPTYEVSPDKQKVVSELSKAAKSAKSVWLASDEDREGEAIAWHLTQVLNLPVESTKRIVFHEITKSAILSAVEHPRTVDMNLVNAQQARRILDRLVGFELSPILWRKVKPALSAGRVQSVTVRLVVEREREIINFKPVPYFRVSAHFFNLNDAKKVVFKADLNKRFDTREQAEAFLNKCSDAEFTVSSVERKPASRYPAAPFTTSTLQQEASRKLGMSVSQTMSTAQRLYENGLITYMRTDSVNLSGQALAASKEEILKSFGEKYSHTRNFKTNSKGAQEAHEAIRPSYFNQHNVEGTPAERRLYELIWKRAVASQMAPAELEKTIVKIEVSGVDEYFTATGEVVLFDGFLKLYSESSDDDHHNGEEEEAILPSLSEGDKLSDKYITATQSFTKMPPRYSEASLVRRLEELGIGRPSTYAPTISTIINRGYVLKQNRDGVKRDYTVLTLENGNISVKTATENIGKEKNRLSPTDIGMIVNDYLEDQFAEIMDYNFTATVEKEFDDIAEGNKDWQVMLDGFYGHFHATVEKALETVPQHMNNERVLGVDPKTGRQVSAKIGRYGPYVQIEGEEGGKPKYASLKKGQLIASITLEEALDLFSLPRMVGELEDKEVVIGIGKYGPYVRYDGKFTSLAKTDDPYTITLERACELIEEKKKQDKEAKTSIVSFPEEPTLMVLKGRYGPYISFEGKNYPIPKAQAPEELTLEQAREIIAKKKKK